MSVLYFISFGLACSERSERRAKLSIVMSSILPFHSYVKYFVTSIVMSSILPFHSYVKFLTRQEKPSKLL